MAVESKSNRCCIRCVCEDYIVRTFCWLSVRPFVNCIRRLWPRDLKMALSILLVWSKNLYLNSLRNIIVRLYDRDVHTDDQQYVDFVNLTLDLSILKWQRHAGSHIYHEKTAVQFEQSTCGPIHFLVTSSVGTDKRTNRQSTRRESAFYSEGRITVS